MGAVYDLFPVTDPTWIFFCVLLVILFAPVLLGKLHIPHVAGMILAGVLVGPFGMHLLEKDSSFDLFGNVGLYYIMFLAGMEIDMGHMRSLRRQAVTLGLMAFVIPLAMGVASNVVVLGYGLVTSVLLASMYASHTLIAYPIVIRYGVARSRSVSIAVGGTIVTDTLTLLTLAFIAGMFRNGYGGEWLFLFLVIKGLALSVLIVFLFPRLARWFFHRYNDYVIQFVFVLALVFLGGGLMKEIGLEGILGAFLVGLVLNRLIPHTAPLMHYLEFVGNALFIPYFLIGVGMIVDLRVLFGSVEALKVAGVMITMALGGKWIASWATQRVFRLSGVERQLMFGLSNAQAAATLAAMLVGYNIILPSGARLLNEDVLNGTVLLILVTCVTSSLITERAARRLALKGGAAERQKENVRVLVAVAYPETVGSLTAMALLMRAEREETPLSAINVVQESDDEARERGMKLLERAANVAAAANVQLQTNVRLATNLSNGIIHAVKENDYGEIVVGLHIPSSSAGSFFGPVLTSLLNRLNRQITMIRCSVPPRSLNRIIVAVPEKAQFEAGFYHWIERVAQLAASLNSRVTFYAHPETIRLLRRSLAGEHVSLRTSFVETDGGNELKTIAPEVRVNDLLVVVMARKGSISYRPSLEHIPFQIRKYYMNTSLMLIFPDVYAAAATKDVSVNEPLTRDVSYEKTKEWYRSLLPRGNEEGKDDDEANKEDKK